MPWRGPEVPGEFPTLGGLVADWIEANCVVPDGELAGQVYKLTTEMERFLLWHYRLDPETGRFAYRRSQLVRPQKWGKGPFSAALICAESYGPVLFDGYDSDGEPVGRAWATPWIQVTAVSEDQTDNVWRALVPMIELGSLAADIPDTGETRINLPGGGRIEPVTSSARSRLGQRITFAVQDETHSWLQNNGGWLLADNQRRNLAGMSGRSIETTNAWDPAENSVAQRTWESETPDVHRDFAQPPSFSPDNKRERRKAMKAVYGDSWWVDLDRIDAEFVEIAEHDQPQAIRFFVNGLVAGLGQAFDPDRWRELANPTLIVPDRDAIVIGVDGARFDDALAVIATHVETGHQWPLGIWERPSGAPDDYEHPFEQVDGVMVEAFDRWKPWRVYIDPQRIEKLVSRWQGRWGEKVVLEWFTNRPRQIGHALRAYKAAQTGGDLTHDGDSVFARHIGNAQKDPLRAKDDEGRPLWTLKKQSEALKIDAAMAGCLSWECRSDAISAGVLNRKTPRKLQFV